MTTLSIGRVGLDLSLDPNRFNLGASSNGQSVSIRGEISNTTEADAISLRNELHRMLEVPDLIVPVAFSTDSSLDGLYKLESVDLEVGSVIGFFPFSASLDRIGHSGRVGIESTLIGGLRTNTNGITTGTYEPWWAIPAAAQSVDQNGWGTLNRVSVDGNVLVFRDIDFTTYPKMTVPIADHYTGAAKVETGATFRVNSGLDCENTPDDWRVSNGIIRLSPNSNPLYMDLQIYESSAWRTVAGAFYLTINGANIASWETVSIIRNDAAAVTIRLQQGQANLLTLDITLRRGSMFAEFRVVRSAATTFRAGRQSADAATALTGGIRDSANDANGNRYIVSSSDYASADTVNGRLVSASSTEWDYAIGVELDGSGSIAGNAAQDLVYQYHAYTSEKMNTVIR